MIYELTAFLHWVFDYTTLCLLVVRVGRKNKFDYCEHYVSFMLCFLCYLDSCLLLEILRVSS